MLEARRAGRGRFWPAFGLPLRLKAGSPPAVIDLSHHAVINCALCLASAMNRINATRRKVTAFHRIASWDAFPPVDGLLMFQVGSGR